MTAEPPGPADVWRDALEALELDVAETERTVLLLQATVDPPSDGRPVWAPPSAPLPASLAPRAADLLARHRAAAAHLTTALAASRRRQRATARMDQRPSARSVYVDKAV